MQNKTTSESCSNSGRTNLPPQAMKHSSGCENSSFGGASNDLEINDLNNISDDESLSSLSGEVDDYLIAPEQDVPNLDRFRMMFGQFGNIFNQLGIEHDFDMQIWDDVTGDGVNPEGRSKTQHQVIVDTSHCYYITLQGEVYDEDDYVTLNNHEGFWMYGGTIGGNRVELLVATHFRLMEELGYWKIINTSGKELRTKLGEFLYHRPHGIPHSNNWQKDDKKQYDLNNPFIRRPISFFRKFWNSEKQSYGLMGRISNRYFNMFIQPIIPQNFDCTIFGSVASFFGSMLSMLSSNFGKAADLVKYFALSVKYQFEKLFRTFYRTVSDSIVLSLLNTGVVFTLFKFFCILIIIKKLVDFYGRMNHMHDVICAIGTFLWGADVDPETFLPSSTDINAEGFTTEILTTLGCVMSVVCGTTVSMTSLNSAFSLANASKNFFSFVGDNLRQIFGTIMYHVTGDQSWIWLPLAKRIVLYCVEIDTWVKMNSDWKHCIQSNVGLKDELKELCEKYNSLMEELQSCAQGISHLIISLKTKEPLILEFRQHIGLIDIVKDRKTPTCLFFYGLPEAGKNTILPMLCRSVYEQMADIEGYTYRGKPLPPWSSDCTWLKAANTEFFDGYNGNYVNRIEEFCASRKIDDRSKLCAEFLDMISKDVLSLNTAFKDKGMKFFTSPIVTVTTNFDDYANTGLTNPTALIRRIHFPIKVTRVGDATDFIAGERVEADSSEIDRYWRFEVMDRSDMGTPFQPKVRAGVYTYARLVLAIVKVVKDHDVEQSLGTKRIILSLPHSNVGLTHDQQNEVKKPKKKEKEKTSVSMKQLGISFAKADTRRRRHVITERGLYSHIYVPSLQRDVLAEEITLYPQNEIMDCPQGRSSIVYREEDTHCELENGMTFAALKPHSRHPIAKSYVLFHMESRIVDSTFAFLYDDWSSKDPEERARLRAEVIPIVVGSSDEEIEGEMIESLLLIGASGIATWLAGKYGPKVSSWGMTKVVSWFKGCSFGEKWDYYKTNPASIFGMGPQLFDDYLEYALHIGHIHTVCQAMRSEMRKSPGLENFILTNFQRWQSNRSFGWASIILLSQTVFEDREMIDSCSWDGEFRVEACDRRLVGIERAINQLFIYHHGNRTPITYAEFAKCEQRWFDRKSELIDPKSAHINMGIRILAGCVGIAGVVAGLMVMKTVFSHIFNYDLEAESNSSKVGTKMPRKARRSKQKQADNIDETIEAQGASQWAEQFEGIRPYLRYVMLQGTKCNLPTWALASGYSIFINKHTLMKLGQLSVVYFKDDCGKKDVCTAYVTGVHELKDRDGVRVDLNPDSMTPNKSIERYLRSRKDAVFKGGCGRLRLCVKTKKDTQFEVQLYVEEGTSATYYSDRLRTVKADEAFSVKEYYVVKNCRGCPGDCGQPYMAFVQAKQRIMGFHFGSWGEDSYVVPLWKEDVLSSPKIIAGGALGDIILAQGAVGNHFEKHILAGTLDVPVYCNTESQFTQSPIFHELKDKGRVNVAPSKLTFFKGDDGEVIDPWSKAFAKVADDLPIKDHSVYLDMLENPEDYYMDYGEPRHSVKELSLDTCLFGRSDVDGDIPIQSADRSTSSTFDYKSKRIKKADLWKLEDDGSHYISPVLVTDFEKLVDMVDNDVEVINVAEAALKDETNSIAKVRIGKTRLFCVSSFLMCMFVKMQLGELFSDLKTHLSDCTSKVGINPHGTPWEWLFDDVNRFDGPFLNGDFGGWDSSIRKLFTYVFFCYCNKYYGYEPGSVAYKRLKAACRSVIGYYLIYGRRVFYMDFSVCSGGWATSIINTFVDHVLHRAAYMWLAFDFTGEYSWANYMTMHFYGDDSLGRVSSKIGHLVNMGALADFFSHYFGLKYTAADKSSAKDANVTIDTMNFLARDFRVTQIRGARAVLAPLSEDSIYGMLAYIRRPKDVDVTIQDQFKINLEVAFMEMFHHGEERYNDFTREMRDCCSNLGGVSFPQYEFYVNQWLGQPQDGM